MSMSVRDLLQQRNKRKQCHDWARVSDLALNVPAIRFMGAHARRRVSCFSLAAHSTPEWHLGGTVFQFATAVLSCESYNARREPATAPGEDCRWQDRWRRRFFRGDWLSNATTHGR